MLSSAPTPFDRLREQVEALMEAGESFGDVERTIDATALSEEHKAALWLVAWSIEDRSEPRQLAAAGPSLTVLNGDLET